MPPAHAQSDGGQRPPAPGRHRAARRRLLFCLLASLPALGQDALLIEHALLIDGSGAPPRADAAIVVEGGRIASVGRSGAARAPSGAEIIDATGKTVVPGIVDLRAHVGLPSALPPLRGCCTREDALRQLGVYASFGVTTIAGSGDGAEFLAAIRARIDADEIPGAARVLTAIGTLAAKGARPRRADGFAGPLQEVDSAREARRSAARSADSGADFIHLWMGRGGGKGLPPEVYRAIIRRAKARGLPVSAQAPRLEDAKRLAAAGVDILTQSVVDRPVDREFIDLLLGNRVVYAAALAAERSAFEYGDRAEWIYDNFFKRSIPNGVAPVLNGETLMRQALDPDRSRRIFAFEQAKRNLKAIAAAGARIGLATGAGAAERFEGYFAHREAQSMQEAGVPPLEIVRAFSTNAAAALGAAEDRGGVSPGKRADFIMLNANPAEDIRNLREIHAVFIGGSLARL